jgi:hypothetical protein
MDTIRIRLAELLRSLADRIEPAVAKNNLWRRLERDAIAAMYARLDRRALEALEAGALPRAPVRKRAEG